MVEDIDIFVRLLRRLDERRRGGVQTSAALLV